MWIKFVCVQNITINVVLSIIDDALANGFEFKVENYALYFREIEY